MKNMDNCAICMVEINLKDSNTTLAMIDEKYMECWHVFHMTCMLKWLQTCHDNGNSKRFPVCRTYWENCTYISQRITRHLEAGESQTAVSDRELYIAVRLCISSSTTFEI